MIRKMPDLNIHVWRFHLMCIHSVENLLCFFHFCHDEGTQVCIAFQLAQIRSPFHIPRHFLRYKYKQFFEKTP